MFRGWQLRMTNEVIVEDVVTTLHFSAGPLWSVPWPSRCPRDSVRVVCLMMAGQGGWLSSSFLTVFQGRLALLAACGSRHGLA